MFCLLLGLIILDSAVALQSPAKRVQRAPRLLKQCRGGALDASAIPGGEWYATELKSNPMRTRMWTSGAIAGGGDVLAQTLASQPFDAERLCAFVLVNALFIAPVYQSLVIVIGAFSGL